MLKRTCQVNVTLRGGGEQVLEQSDSDCEHIEK